MTLEQQVEHRGLSDGLTDRVLHLLSDNVFSVLGIMLISMAAACGLVSIVNQFRVDSDLLPMDEVRRYNRVSQAMAHGFGFLFSGMGVYGYLVGGVAERAYLTMMLALIAGGGTPYLYDLFWWIRERAAPAVGRAVLSGLKGGAEVLTSKALGAFYALWRRGRRPDEPK